MTIEIHAEPKPTINEPLLQKVLDHVTAHPEEHEQRMWMGHGKCGTAGCVAGWALHFAGHELSYADIDPVVAAVNRVHWLSAFEREATLMHDGRNIALTARQELGLGRVQAATLFDERNSLDDLWRLVEEWTDGRVCREVGP